MSSKGHHRGDGKGAVAAKTDNVSVVLRCRPQNNREMHQKEPTIVQCNQQMANVNIQITERNAKLSKRFNFDHVFGTLSTQHEVYDTVVAPVVHEVLEGFNCTVFAYGQTGTGKTHTMEGDLKSDDNKGIIPRAVEHIFETLNARKEMEYSVKISFLELYNEQLDDLLVSGENTPELRLCEDKKRGVVVQNLENVLVTDAKAIYDQLDNALQKRKVSETKMNKQSSRSHTVFTLTIHIKESTPEGEDIVKVGKLNLVDLAGSECVGRSGATGDRKREAGNINQSLLTLGRVISALVEKRGHIPYRDSKLTRLLQESLGGRAKTTIIATISPSADASDETLSTLSYASRAKSIENRPEINQRMTKRTLIKEYSVEISRIKEELQAAREKNGVFLPKDRYDELCEDLERKTNMVEELEGALERRKVEFEEIKVMFGITKEELESTLKELKETQIILGETQYVLEDREDIFKGLADEASKALGTGNIAIKDVSDLHAKVERKANVVEDNTSTTIQFIAKTHQTAESIFKAVERASHDFNENDKNLVAQVDSFSESSALFSKHLISVLAKVSDSVQAFSASFATTKSEHNAEFKKQQNTMHDNIFLSLKSVTDMIESREQNVQSWIESQKVALGDAKKFREDYFQTKFHPSLDSLKETTSKFEQSISRKVKKNADEMTKNLDSAVQSIGSFATQAEKESSAFKKEQKRKFEKHIEEAKQERDEMFQQFQSMFNAFSAKQNERFENALDASHEHEQNFQAEFSTAIQNQRKILETVSSDHGEAHARDVNGEIDGFHADSASMYEDMGAQANLFQQDCARTDKKTGETLTSFLIQSTSTMNDLTAATETFRSTMEASWGETDTFVSDVMDKNVANVEAHCKLFVDEHEKEIINTVEAEHSKQDASVAVFREILKSVKEHNVSTSDTVLSQVGTIQTETTSLKESLRTDVPTGATPVKKEYPMPKSLSSLQPRDIILSKLRHDLSRTSSEASSVASLSPLAASGDENAEEEIPSTPVSCEQVSGDTPSDSNEVGTPSEEKTPEEEESKAVIIPPPEAATKTPTPPPPRELKKTTNQKAKSPDENEAKKPTRSRRAAAAGKGRATKSRIPVPKKSSVLSETNNQ
jgi:kinesin family member 11